MRRWLSLCCLLGCAIHPAHAGVVLSSSSTKVQAGGPMQLQLTFLNDDAQSEMQVEIPEAVHVRLETEAALSVLEFQPSRTGPLVLQPGEFIRIELSGVAPSAVQGAVSLQATGFDANPLLLQLDPAQAAQPEAPARRELGDVDSMLVDKPPPLALSTYEPLYLLFGGAGGANAKFQISFRYQLFDGEGPLARRLPWIDDLYLSFSQTSLWDLSEISKPFTDSSYRPRLFYANYDLARVLDGRLRVGVESGFGHESNGKEGEASRSFNMFYVRPTLTFGDPDGLRAWFAPLVHNYIAEDENDDLSHYRGYVDWLFGVGSKGGVDFFATLRKGTHSDYGSLELNLSYPLSKLSSGDLTGWLMLQYFAGYGESLIDYNEKLDAQLRLGIAVAL